MAGKKKRGGGRKICCPKGARKVKVKGRVRCKRGKKIVARRKSCKRRK